MATIIAERDAKITDAAKDIQELVGLFKDMAELVEDQAPGIDTVAHNVTVAEDKTRKGLEDVREAERLHNSAPCVVQ